MSGHSGHTCPTRFSPDTSFASSPAESAKALTFNDLIKADTLSAFLRTVVRWDRPDKIPPPFRGGLSVSAAPLLQR